MFGFGIKKKQTNFHKISVIVFFIVLSIEWIIVSSLYGLGKQFIGLIAHQKDGVEKIITTIEKSTLIQSGISWGGSKVTHLKPSLFQEVFKNFPEIKQYLGFDKEKKYLIILQNTSELRPNGGFYGSFGLLSLKSGQIISLKIEDSYLLPYLNSGVAIQLPERATGIFDKNITFIAGNKFGLTSLDGRNIKMIFEGTFPSTTIDGVIFISTDAIIAVDQSFSEQILERQFINAATDLIRGQNIPYKKEEYIKEVSNHLQKNKSQLIKSGIININKLRNNGLVNIYLHDASTGLNHLISDWGFTTNPSSGSLYARDINHAENKIDSFLTKHTQMVSDNGDIVDGKDRIELTGNQGILSISYVISIPTRYLSKVSSREKKYNVTLGEREQYILCTRRPTTNHFGIILMPSGREVSSFSGNFIKPPHEYPSPYGVYVTYQWGGEGYEQNYIFSFNIRKRIESK